MVRSRDGDGIKSNIIILEVQKRPCLYDTNDPYYGDRSEKMRSWEEVYACVVPGWSSYGLTEKLVAGKEVQKRWRSIRDSYTKAYRQGKCPHPEQVSPNSRRYQYHKQMSFLLRALQNKKPRYSQDKYDSFSEVSSSPQHPTPDDIPRINQDIKPLDLKTKSDVTVIQDTPVKLDMIKPESYDKECQVALDAERKQDAMNEATAILPEDHFGDDRLFMNSLLPLFKKMSDDTRLLCRIEVLKIIRYALQGHKCFEDLKVAEDSFFKNQMTEILTKEEPSLKSLTTQAVDGSRPVRKRKTRSLSPAPTPVKKRGPGRPRKVRPPNESDEEQTTKKQLMKRLIKPKLAAKLESLPPEEDSYGFATTINQLPMRTFMKMLNLERSSSNDPVIQVKTEPEEMPID